jgi:disulfide bond formation protein DsbB
MLEPTTRFPWLLIAGSAFALELTAVFFQYGMNLDPCVLCVYQRAAVVGLVIGGLVGAALPEVMAVRILGYLVIAGSAGIGLYYAWVHAGVLKGSSFECSFLPDFPTWMPLHEWVPQLFQPTGLCGELDWYFLGFTMPEVMIAIFAAYLAALGYALVREIGLPR